MGRLLSRLGIGAAEVETHLETETVRPGTTVDLRVEVTGGSSRQDIDEIRFALATEVVDDGERSPVTIVETSVTEAFTIAPDEERTFEGTVTVPYDTPMTTYGDTRVWIDTGLHIAWAVDPADRDEFTVVPDERIELLVEDLEELSLVLSEVDCRPPPQFGGLGGRPFVQVFTFDPRGAPFATEFAELEVMPILSERDLEIVFLIDRHSDMLRDMTSLHVDTRGGGGHLTVTDPHPTALRKRLEDEILSALE
jgi:sporulation-control protein